MNMAGLRRTKKSPAPVQMPGERDRALSRSLVSLTQFPMVTGPPSARSVSGLVMVIFSG